MLKPPDTVSIAFVQGMLSGVGYPVADCDEWLIDAGIAPGLLAESAARVTAAQYVALFRLLMDRRDDEFLGLLSRPLRRGVFALMVYSTLGAPTLSRAILRMARTLRLLQDDVAVVLVEEGALVGLQLHFTAPASAARTFLHELLLRVFWQTVSWLHGGRLRAARFDFAFTAPAHFAEYAKVFPGLVRFSQARSGVWFEASCLSAPMLHDETSAKAFLALAPGIVIVPRRRERGLSSRVRGHLQAHRPAWPDLRSTADALHLSTSTLQRRLAGEGTSFQALKDQLRCDAAIVRLNTTPSSLQSIAQELGFADSPAFQRAFKSWTGSAPGAYRRAR